MIGFGDSIEDVLKRLLPGRAQTETLHIAPPMPPDVFAAAAYLLQISGAHHHIQPDDNGKRPIGECVLRITDKMRDEAVKVGAEWKALPISPFEAPSKVRSLWEQLVAKGDQPIFVQPGSRRRCPTWWQCAARLMFIADCAVSDEIGWEPALNLSPRWLVAKSIVLEEIKTQRALLGTIAFETNQDIANVLPKARTAGVGCTIRSLSHHLALLPPRGIAKAYWVSPVQEPLHASRALNLLVIPFPYRIRASSFRRRSPDTEELLSRTWGWFDVQTHWLAKLKSDDLVKWIDALIRAAEKDCSEIHGIVLPELALDHTHYDRILSLRAKHPKLDLFISGLCSKKTDDGVRNGNFVATTMFGRLQYTHMGAQRIREKHHRWKLDEPQIGGYALSSSLRPMVDWWEQLNIYGRSIDVFVFRKEAILTTLICEDLARIDPCQELVRAIGPNLVIALLMDSAQISTRWPARYATVLAEDPGCSVLTVTSRGLLDRANAERSFPPSDAVALWRDDTGVLRSIEVSREADAVVLSLAGHRRPARTLDGRSVPNSVSWRYHGQQPVRADVSQSLRRRIKDTDG